MEYAENQKVTLTKLEQLIEEQGSQAGASSVLGITPSIISALRKGTYTGNVDFILEKIEDYFKVKEQYQKIYKTKGYVKTSISEKVYGLLELCQTEGGIAIACGDAGIGKTKAVFQYKKEHPNNCFVITLNPCFSSVKSVLGAVADEIGADKPKSKDGLWLSLKNKLSDSMLIIIDEAQNLNFGTIEALRSLSDAFEREGQTLGIAFVGNPGILSYILSDRAKFAQIISRKKTTGIYTTSKIQREDIQKLFPMIANKDLEIDYLWKIAKSIQGVRGTVNIFDKAVANGNYTYEGIKAVVDALNIII